MSFFQKLRAAFGLGSGADSPIDTLDGVLLEETIAIENLNKAQVDFDEISESLELKIKACGKMIEKGYKQGISNKDILQKKLDKVTDEFLPILKAHSDKVLELQAQRSDMEAELIAKAVHFVALLDEPEQAYLNDIMRTWEETGLIEGEECETHLQAITKSVGLVQDFFFNKAHAASVGDTHTWKDGDRYTKTNKGWVPVKKNEIKHSTQEVVAHAENTSIDQLSKIAKDASKPSHIRDAAKREIERRSAETDKEKRKWDREDKVRAEDRAHDTKDKKDEAKAKEKEQAAAAAKPKPEPVAEPVKKKKIPDVIKYTPAESLKDDHRKIEKSFGKKLNKGYDKLKAKYSKQFGNVLNTDNARELSKDYLANKSELSSAVHEPASAFVKKMYDDLLKDKVPKGRSNMVYFTAGGTGSGKSSSLMGQEKKYHDKAHVIFDTNMNGFESSSKKIEQALDAGKKVRINYVFRDPIDAFKNGAVPRSLRVGRTVPIEEHIRTHLGSINAILGLKEKYKGNKNVSITVTDNSRGFGNAQKAPIGFVKEQEKKYLASEIREQLHKINNQLYERGEISERHWKGFRG